MRILHNLRFYLFSNVIINMFKLLGDVFIILTSYIRKLKEIKSGL